MWPVLFKIGNFGIRSYGVMIIISFFVCLWLAKHEGKRLGLTNKLIDHLANYLLLGGLIGARFYYAIFYDPRYYFTKPWTLLFIWEGGLAIHGAIIGGLISIWLFSRKNKISFLTLADLISPILLLGQAIGRIGCFLNGCCYGLPTNKPWGVIFPKGSFAYYQFGFQTVHPTELYEMVLNLTGFIILWLIRKNKLFPGCLFSLYLIFYGVIRFIVSFFRADSLYLWETHIRIAHITSSVMIFLGLFLFRYFSKKFKGA